MSGSGPTCVETVTSIRTPPPAPGNLHLGEVTHIS